MQYYHFNPAVLASYWKIALLISTLLITQGVFAHGYVSEPESRPYKCKLGKKHRLWRRCMGAAERGRP